MQNPSVRPGRPSPRARPTGTPQSEREQNRLRSGTSGFSSTIERGSGRGTPGTSTRPAPSRPRPVDPAVEPELRTDTERPVDFPDRDRDNRPETERRDCEERDVRDVRVEARELFEDELPPPEPRLPLPATPVDGEPTMPLDTTGASPHVSQYSSPPPMSS
ncbi:hypothetical protein GCM10009540_72750 [Streptomyces turgidiscabies]